MAVLLAFFVLLLASSSVYVGTAIKIFYWAWNQFPVLPHLVQKNLQWELVNIQSVNFIPKKVTQCIHQLQCVVELPGLLQMMIKSDQIPSETYR